MTRLAGALVAAIGLAACTQPPWPEEPPADACAAGAIGPEERLMRFEGPDGARRAALVWYPDGPGPHEVIVALHEFASEPRRQVAYTKMLDLAKQRNAILVGPDGKTASWNAGGCCGKSRDRHVDDVGFLDQVIARVDKVGCTSGRVTVTGIGAGGMMAHAWACESDVPDAVLSVGGGLQMLECGKTRPIPLVHYHGENDAWMPADGSKGHLPLSTAIEQWSKRNGGVEADPIDGGALLCRTWSGSAAPTRFCTVRGMRDLWPGASDAPFDGPDGPIDATRDAFAVFDAYWAENP